MAMRHAWMAALCLAAAQAARARVYGVDDLLALEGYGKAVFAPDGRWAAIEKMRPYGAGMHYNYDSFTSRALRRVMRIDLKNGQQLAPLFPQDEEAGYWMGTASPTGKLLTVFRLQGASLSLGIAEPGQARVKWLDGVPATPLLNPHPTWIDDNHLLALTLVGISPGYPLDIGMRLQHNLPERWDATAKGKAPGVSVLSSLNNALRPTAELSVIDLGTGTRHALARDRIVDLALSADRKWAAISVETALARPDPAIPVTSSDLAFKHTIRVINLATGQSTDVCNECETIANLLSWAPDRPRLLFYHRKGSTSWNNGTLSVYDAPRRTSRPAFAYGITASMFTYGRGEGIVTAGWISNSPALLGTAARDSSPKWYGPEGPIAWHSPKGCSAKSIAWAKKGPIALCGDTVRGLGIPREQALVTAPASLFAHAYEDYFDVGVRAKYDPFVRADAIAVASTGTEPRAWWVDGRSSGSPIALPAHVDRFLGGVPEGPVLSITRDAHGIGGLWLSRAGNPPRMIDAINLHLAGIDWPRLRRIDAPGGDSDWLLLPPGADDKQKHPLVIIPYPGTKFGSNEPRTIGADDTSINTNAQLLAAAGYAVLLPSMAEHRERANPIDDMGAEIEAAADRAIATGLIDADRMAVYGHSYGGYTAIAVAEQSQRFAAYIASAAGINLFGAYGEFLPYDRIDLEDGFPNSFAYGWYEKSQAGLRGPPWAETARYVRNNPLLQLDRIQKPVLLLGGDIDYASVSGAERLYAGLYRLGRDVTLVRYWGEGHNVRSPANIRDFDKRLKDWLGEKLGSVTSSAPPKAQAK